MKQVFPGVRDYPGMDRALDPKLAPKAEGERHRYVAQAGAAGNHHPCVPTHHLSKRRWIDAYDALLTVGRILKSLNALCNRLTNKCSRINVEEWQVVECDGLKTVDYEKVSGGSDPSPPPALLSDQTDECCARRLSYFVYH